MKVYKEKPNSIKVISTIVICAICLCTIVLIFQFIKINNLKARKDNLYSASETLTQEIMDYDKQIEYCDKNRELYLQDYAREVKNWGKSDRTYYVSK